MVPLKFAIDQWRGDSLALTVRLWQDVAHTIPVDMTGATATAQVRETPADPDPAKAEFVCAITGNEVLLTLTPTQTRDLPPSGYWDCQVDWASDGTRITTVAAGTIKVQQDVTR